MSYCSGKASCIFEKDALRPYLHITCATCVCSDGDVNSTCCGVVQAALPNQHHAELIELTGLKGRIGQRCIVMGMISSTEDGGCSLEDEGAVVSLELSSARIKDGLVTGGKQGLMKKT